MPEIKIGFLGVKLLLKNCLQLDELMWESFVLSGWW